MKSNFLLFLMLLFFACHDGNTSIFDAQNVVVPNFPEVQNLQGEKMDLEILGVNDIYVVDTFLIAFKATGYNNFFEVYSTISHQYLGKFLEQGRGPNEFLSVQYNYEFYRKNDNIILFVLDGAQQKRACFNLTQSLKRNQAICDTIYRIRTSYNYFNLNDSLHAQLRPVLSNWIWEIQRNDGNQILAEYKILKSYVPKSISVNALAAGAIKHPFRNDFVCNLLHFNQLNIFSVDRQKNVSISYGEPINIFETLKRPDSELMNYYVSMVPTAEYIYALYVGKPDKQYPYWEGAVEIHVYDWEGQPISKMAIPENIIYFAVDEINKYIYGLKITEEIFRYKYEL